jgi:hypothetical protein
MGLNSYLLNYLIIVFAHCYGFQTAHLGPFVIVHNSLLCQGNLEYQSRPYYCEGNLEDWLTFNK